MDIDTSIFRNKTFQGDCVEVLRTMPDNLIDCCITSPPYYGLRDYGIDGQIGLEQTPEEYVAKLVDVFREVRRILKPEGTIWLNLGDSYSSLLRSGRKESPGVGAKQEMSKVHTNVKWHAGDGSKFQWTLPGGQKPKDLIGIPWAVAFALRADGWYLRSDIIWQKPNAMPESVTDRPTKSHEYLFLLSKSQRYYYDAEAIKEANVTNQSLPDLKRHWSERPNNGAISGKGGYRMGSIHNGRNKRTVWTIPTRPYKAAHFATFPEKLIEPCILAGTSERGYCPECGKPWVRQVERKASTSKKCPKTDAIYQAQGGNGEKHTGTIGMSGSGRIDGYTKTIGWHPSCSCGLDPTPGIVLDPFFGAGTSGLVAKKWGRDFVGIELNPDYIKMAEERIFGPQTL